MVYALYITFVLSGQIYDVPMKSYDRFEECWEAATILVRGRDNMTARCVLVEK